MWVKAEFHSHCRGDPLDDVAYAPEALLDRAAAMGYKVFAITCHRKVVHTKALERYAARKGILLIPGAELRIQGRDLLAYNLTDAEAQRLRTFGDLRRWKRRKHLAIAPHPFYPIIPPQSLNEHLEPNIGLFDAIEWCHCYTGWLNPFNPRAAAVAKRHGLPMVGTSDCHHWWQFHGKTHTLIDVPARPTVRDVIRAVRQGRVRAVSQPLSFGQLLRTIVWVVWGTVHGLLRRPRQPL